MIPGNDAPLRAAPSSAHVTNMLSHAVSRVSLGVKLPRVVARVAPRASAAAVGFPRTSTHPTATAPVQRLGARGFAATKIDGTKIAGLVRQDVAKDVDKFTRRIGRKPGLAVVLVRSSVAPATCAVPAARPLPPRAAASAAIVDIWYRNGNCGPNFPWKAHSNAPSRFRTVLWRHPLRCSPVASCASRGPRYQVGERPDSAKYVEMKKKAAAECGFESIERVRFCRRLAIHARWVLMSVMRVCLCFCAGSCCRSLYPRTSSLALFRS